MSKNKHYKLVAARSNKGYTQTDMALILETGKSTYCQKENGHREFKESEINKILQLLDEKYEDIFLP